MIFLNFYFKNMNNFSPVNIPLELWVLAIDYLSFSERFKIRIVSRVFCDAFSISVKGSTINGTDLKYINGGGLMVLKEAKFLDLSLNLKLTRKEIARFIEGRVVGIKNTFSQHGTEKRMIMIGANKAMTLSLVLISWEDVRVKLGQSLVKKDIQAGHQNGPSGAHHLPTISDTDMPLNIPDSSKFSLAFSGNFKIQEVVISICYVHRNIFSFIGKFIGGWRANIRSLKTLIFPNYGIEDRDLYLLRNLNIKKLEIFPEKVTSKGLEYIKNVEDLKLNNYSILNFKLEDAINKLTKLKKINLDFNGVNDVSLAAISHIEEIKINDFCDRVTFEGLSLLKNSRKLYIYIGSATHINNDLLKLYSNNIERLTLGGCGIQIDDEGVMELGKIKKLGMKQWERATNKGLYYISRHKILRKLLIQSNDNITDEGLDCLLESNILKIIIRDCCHITEEKIEYLREKDRNKIWIYEESDYVLRGFDLTGE